MFRNVRKAKQSRSDATTDSLIVELPEDKNLRARLFKEIGKHAVKQGFDPDEDVGQKYLFMHW